MSRSAAGPWVSTAPPRKRRLALTGPFGALLVLSVVDRRSIEVRMSLDRDARLADQAAAKEPT